MKKVSLWVAALGALVLPLAFLAPAANAAAPTGTRSLAAVLTADKNGFDRNSRDFDITTAAVLAVLKAKPDSPVKVLTDGNVALTAFIPTDNAFRKLAKALTGQRIRSEKAIFDTLAAKLGVDTIEKVLLYHVVPGATITKAQALKADETRLDTAAGLPIRVNVRHHPTRVRIQDLDKNYRNAQIVKFNINKGNKQIAHGISEVLRPPDL